MKKLILLMAMISVLIVGMASAFTATINTPASSGTITAASKLNVSVANWGDNDTIRCAIVAYSSSTANSSARALANITNATGQSESVNITFSADLILEDSNDYTFAATCYNGTTEGTPIAVAATSVTNVIVSRTTPSVPTTSHASETVFDENSATITYTVTGTDTTGCRISFGRQGLFSGTNTYAMTHSGNSCTYVVTEGNPPEGDYVTQVRASDGVDTAISANRDFVIDFVESDTPDIGDGLQVDIGRFAGMKISDNMITAIIVIIVALVLFGKKGRR